jgi:uncharacterized alkaline shock family protein YloU
MTIALTVECPDGEIIKVHAINFYNHIHVHARHVNKTVKQEISSMTDFELFDIDDNVIDYVPGKESDESIAYSLNYLIDTIKD